jgi:serine/threonine-protein kinase
MSMALESFDLAAPSAVWTMEEQIGEYLVRRMVGEGGMGKVYEAEERLSKRRVALKVMRDELSQSEDARRLFLNEMQILAHLEHPNIVRSLASVEAEGKLVTVLEYLDGVTLRQLLGERRRLSWEQASHVVLQVAKALVAAHGQSPPVIHRDLKPENIMVLEGGDVKVMDFGIAKLLQELNQTNTQSVGTLQYMSPEQIDAQTIDERSDLYCLGLVFYELLSGHPPFQSASPRTLLNMQCTEAPPPLDDDVRIGLAKGIEKLLFQLLTKDPSARPDSAAAVVEHLEMFVPDRGFEDLLDPGSAPSIRRRAARPSGGGTDPLEGAADAGRGDDARSDDERTMPSAEVVEERARSKRGSERELPERDSRPTRRSKSKPEIVPERHDTIALVEAASSERELSGGVSVAVIVLLMLVAAVATYMWRASQVAPASEDEDEDARLQRSVPAMVVAAVPTGHAPSQHGETARS